MVPVRRDRYDSMPIASGVGKHHETFLASNNFGKKIIRLKNALSVLLHRSLREQAQQ